MSEASVRLIDWDLRGDMHEFSCSHCGQEAGLHQHNTSMQLLRRIDRRFQRMAHVVTVGALALVSLLAAVLVVLLLGILPSGRQSMVTPKEDTPVSEKLHVCNPPERDAPTTLPPQQPEGWERPSILLTAPYNHSNNNKYLEWEHEKGIAYRYGGFSYSGGNLTVPKDGMYNIKLQITLECVGDGEVKHEPEQLSMAVYLWQEGYHEFRALLSSYYTMSCDTKTEDRVRKSQFISGTVVLKAGCILRVQEESYRSKHIKRSREESELFFAVHFQGSAFQGSA